MRIDIRGTNLRLTPALLDHVERRVRSALVRHRDHVRGVTVRVVDVNGDRGGLDKQCRLVVQTTARRNLIVEDVDIDLYAAVTRAAARASEGIRRRAGRRRGRGRRSEDRERASLPGRKEARR
jgi:putative sigma-54 modulation protein